MSNDAQVVVTPPGSLERLGTALRDYRRVSGRTSEEVLVKKGEDLAMRGPNGTSLHALFKAQAQRAGVITAATMLRGFRLGRRRFGGSGAAKGISETAADRAEKLMGPYLKQHSILANVSFWNGRISITGVRQSRAGRRILGGRRGNRGFAVGGDSRLLGDGGFRMAGDKRLNFRAVATVMEINLREAGRKFLASGFLFRRFARIQKERVLRTMNPRSRVALQAEATLEGQADRGDLALRLTSHIPGTLELGNIRSLFTRALDYLREDLEVYLARKQREALVKTVRTAVA